MFLIEAVPAIILGVAVLLYLDDGNAARGACLALKPGNFGTGDFSIPTQAAWRCPLPSHER